MSRRISQRSALTREIYSLLRAISPPEYRTSIGNSIFIGEGPIEEKEAPYCLLIPDEEIPAEDSGLNAHVLITYSIIGYVNTKDASIPEFASDPVAEYAIIDAIIADIRDCLEGFGCQIGRAASILYMGGSPIYTARGGEIAGARVRYQIQTPYIDYMPGQ